jgi:uncharacterized protein YbjT (DUF2867 family)
VCRVAVLGASGYTGAEVARLCALHPNIKITALTGDKQAGKARARRSGAAECGCCARAQPTRRTTDAAHPSSRATPLPPSPPAIAFPFPLSHTHSAPTALC